MEPAYTSRDRSGGPRAGGSTRSARSDPAAGARAALEADIVGDVRPEPRGRLGGGTASPGAGRAGRQAWGGDRMGQPALARCDLLRRPGGSRAPAGALGGRDRPAPPGPAGQHQLRADRRARAGTPRRGLGHHARPGALRRDQATPAAQASRGRHRDGGGGRLGVGRRVPRLRADTQRLDRRREGARGSRRCGSRLSQPSGGADGAVLDVGRRPSATAVQRPGLRSRRQAAGDRRPPGCRGRMCGGVPGRAPQERPAPPGRRGPHRAAAGGGPSEGGRSRSRTGGSPGRRPTDGGECPPS